MSVLIWSRLAIEEGSHKGEEDQEQDQAIARVRELGQGTQNFPPPPRVPGALAVLVGLH